jgi:hypothetical protein
MPRNPRVQIGNVLARPLRASFETGEKPLGGLALTNPIELLLKMSDTFTKRAAMLEQNALTLLGQAAPTMQPAIPMLERRLIEHNRLRVGYCTRPAHAASPRRD